MEYIRWILTHHQYPLIFNKESRYKRSPIPPPPTARENRFKTPITKNRKRDLPTSVETVDGGLRGLPSQMPRTTADTLPIPQFISPAHLLGSTRRHPTTNVNDRLTINLQKQLREAAGPLLPCKSPETIIHATSTQQEPSKEMQVSSLNETTSEMKDASEIPDDVMMNFDLKSRNNFSFVKMMTTLNSFI